MVTSPSFDVSLSDIGVPLAFGATLCPVADDIVRQPSRLLAFLTDLRITVADLTPAYLRLFGGADLPTLRVLVTGGEAPFPADVRRYAGTLRYLNAYGPTENTISSTMGLLSPEDRGFLSCGRPLPNTSVAIRDPAGNPVPPGTVGEIWLGGVGLAKGYLNCPDLTAASFVETREGRRYRTGDLGRWRAPGELADGELEVLGRIDDQVKLNGIRIELGEIEHALEAHPAVGQAVALITGEASATQGLWAFVSPKPGMDPPPGEGWRDHLAGHLPSYMIPAAVIPVPAIPLSPSGKVDKAALTALLADRPQRAARQPPQDATEAAVARAWQEALRCGPVCRDDDFFSLGGHSLLAIAVAHRLEAEFGHPVPARELFAEPTLAGFARRIGETAAIPRPAEETATSDRATEGEREFRVAELAGLDTTGFNISLALEVLGEVPADERWLAAWATLVARHEALRTGFREDDLGVLRRVVAAAGAGTFEIGAAPDRAAALAEIRVRQLAPFAMDAPPLWRAGLMRVAGTDGALFWLVLHHSVGDGLSLGVLAEELEALLRGEALAPCAGSPARSAAREEAYLASAACRDDAAYWRASVGDAGAPDEWPLDFPRPTRAARESHLHRARLDAATAGALRQFAQRNGTSLHALMLTLLALEVRRRTGRGAFLLGTAASTRETAAEARAVGYYVNMLPLPCRMRQAAPVEEALAATRRALADGIRHSRYPFARIYQDFRRDRPATAHAGRHPLFDIAVTEDPGIASGEREDSDALSFRFGAAGTFEDDGVRYDLRDGGPAQDMVLIHEGQPDGSLVLQWRVSAALYERETAAAWLDALLGAAHALADPTRRPGTPLPALLPEEQAKLAAWEHGPALPHPAPCLHDMVARLAASQPDRPALVTEAGALSYAELNARADALAHALLGLGVARGEPVGVLTERSAALPGAALAIWKAGACYLPLTRDLPAERLAFIARDAGIRVLVVLDGHEPPPELAEVGCRIVRPENLQAGAAPPAHDGDPDDPAYILYTSGSTGVPKGVVLRHRGMMNLALGATTRFDVEPADRVLLMSSPSFDLWISDLVMAWAAGAAVVPVTRREMDDIPGMRAKLARLGVTMASMPPSYLRLFDRAGFPGLRFLMTVGEPPHPGDARHYAGQLAYWNGYGPTENTAAATFSRVPPGAARLTAGRPLPNTSVHVLDADGAPVPPGAVGQIWLGGMGLAVGYLNRPELTAASFHETPAGRRYNTGDLGRWTAGGELLVLGRADSQVKLRGQRVELGEIEHALESQPEVAQAVALVEAQNGAQSLWAFVALHPGAAEPAAAEWRRRLAAKLPRYMVPASVIPVPAIPTTLAGKVDRPALLRALVEYLGPSDSAGPASDADGSRTPPRGAVEGRVAEIWAEQLQHPAIAREDNFFELGGDSLRAIAVVNKVRREFDCKINDLYENPVLADFAAVCKPQIGHLDSLVRSAIEHWREYGAGLEAYDAARDAVLSEAERCYRDRNRIYEDRDFGLRRDYGRGAADRGHRLSRSLSPACAAGGPHARSHRTRARCRRRGRARPAWKGADRLLRPRRRGGPRPQRPLDRRRGRPAPGRAGPAVPRSRPAGGGGAGGDRLRRQRQPLRSLPRFPGGQRRRDAAPAGAGGTPEPRTGRFPPRFDDVGLRQGARGRISGYSPSMTRCRTSSTRTTTSAPSRKRNGWSPPPAATSPTPVSIASATWSSPPTAVRYSSTSRRMRSSAS